ncbi:MAG: aminoacyl-tRNA hydrolase [Actinomycetota bacterium]
MTWLVAGLGNPGDRYANTRHNVGRMVVGEMARHAGERFKKVRFLPVEVAEVREAGGERVLLAASTRFMNESGPSYASLANKHDVEAHRLIAVYDELDIPAGELRVKLGGGSSHNGVKSLQQALRSREFLHVRIGIGRPPGRQDPADFVLQPIGKKLEADIAVWVDHAADAVRSLIADGLVATQDRFNRQTP